MDISKANTQSLIGELGRVKALRDAKIKTFVEQGLAKLEKLWEKLDLQDLRDEFFRVHARADLYCSAGCDAIQNELMQLQRDKKLIRLVMEREQLSRQMKEFEVSASDPRRLFKSSVQLVQVRVCSRLRVCVVVPAPCVHALRVSEYYYRE